MKLLTRLNDLIQTLCRNLLTGANKGGVAICKWTHYFDIYDHHFCRFRGQEVLKIGVYSGGSLEMWREYFGPKALIYGVDIEPDCRACENDGIKIFIGDQADRSFWREFCRKVPPLDIVIDDGGHEPELQIVSVEELLPVLRSGASISAKTWVGHTTSSRHMCMAWGTV